MPSIYPSSGLPSTFAGRRPVSCQVKIRYRSQPAVATVEILPGSRFRVCFDEPCRGIAPAKRPSATSTIGSWEEAGLIRLRWLRNNILSKVVIYPL